MKTYAERKAVLERLEARGLKTGDWIWLKATDEAPRQRAQLKSPLAVVLVVTMTPESAADDGLRVINVDAIEGPA